MFKLPTYDQIMNSMKEEDESLRGNVKIKTSTETHVIPRKNFEKVKNSEFGIAFIKEQKDEIEWSHSDKIVEEFVINLLKNQKTNFQFKLSKGTIDERIYIMNELQKLGLDDYFKTTSLGINWDRLINLQTYYKDVLYNDEFCAKLSEIIIRALNKALEFNIYKGTFEVTHNGKIALNGKEITRDVISLNGKNEEYIDDNNLLINFCLYCDIEKYWDKVYQGIIILLSGQKESQPWQENLLVKEQICNTKTGHCCFQSTCHRHFHFNLVDYINYQLN